MTPQHGINGHTTCTEQHPCRECGGADDQTLVSLTLSHGAAPHVAMWHMLCPTRPCAVLLYHN
eukprot:353791-Chlamydomonas_euryale.AAC.3